MWTLEAISGHISNEDWLQLFYKDLGFTPAFKQKNHPSFSSPPTFSGPSSPIMLPSVHLLALVGAAAAAEVTLTWAHDKGSGLSALVATKAGASKPVALSCSSILEGASSVDFSHLDADGGGNFTIGDQSYLVHSDPSFSGGPRCVTVYDDVISFDQCTDVEWDVDASAAAGPEAAVVDCFENETIKDKLRNLLEVFGDHEPSTGETSPAQIGHIDNSTLTALVEASGVDKRQCGLVYGTVLIGNGEFSSSLNTASR